VKNPPRWLYVLITLLLLAAVFFFSSRERLVDPDEGAYLLAAKLVMEGKSLFTDFFWPQMPLLPYAYGAWMKFFGTNWYAARASPSQGRTWEGFVLLDKQSLIPFLSSTTGRFFFCETPMKREVL
jgi:hypothetical protein